MAHGPRIDGVLDDEVWDRAVPVRTFVQRSPREGAPPGLPSELRVLHDGAAIYFGLRLWDEEPGRIRRGLGRRDSIPDSDWITVYLDPLLTGERGYYFQLNASGVQADGLVYREVNIDGSWDASWTGAARVDGQGWTAELRVPLTSISFQDRRKQSWGLYVSRHIQRIKQAVCWPAMPKDTNTFVSRFGRLTGLEGLKRGRPLQVRPYAGGEVQLQRGEGSLRPGGTFRPSGGVDLLYGHGGELMLHLAVNPDFGQVEDDPAVVNLGPNEVYFAEKRPFFVAGADLFRTPITLLHTRRIGARPPAPEARSDDGEIVELDAAARIAGALKAVGRAGSADYGVLSAAVLPAGAVERAGNGERESRRAAPARHYGAGRLRLRVARRVHLGLMATGRTALEREADESDAYSGGLDWDLLTGSGWQTTGQLTGAAAEPGSGYGLWAMAGQRGARRWRYWVEAESFSPDYEINDVGYQWRANMVRLRPYLMRRLPAPWGWLREWYALVWGQEAFRHSDPDVSFDRRVELQSYGKLDNLWAYWVGVGHRLPTRDDRETRGGPVYPRPREVYGWIGGETDTARRLVLDATFSGAREADAVTLTLEGNVHAALLDRLRLTLYWRWRRVRGMPRWVETLEQEGDRPRHIFGDLDQDELELKLHGLLALHRTLTLQLFTQLLHSVGVHDNPRELLVLDDGETTLGGTDQVSDADFSRVALIINAVLRWDLGGGAAAYLVYKAEAQLDADGGPVPRGLDMGRIGELWDRDQTHLLLFKVSYNF